MTAGNEDVPDGPVPQHAARAVFLSGAGRPRSRYVVGWIPPFGSCWRWFWFSPRHAKNDKGKVDPVGASLLANRCPLPLSSESIQIGVARRLGVL